LNFRHKIESGISIFDIEMKKHDNNVGISAGSTSNMKNGEIRPTKVIYMYASIPKSVASLKNLS